MADVKLNIMMRLLQEIKTDSMTVGLFKSPVGGRANDRSSLLPPYDRGEPAVSYK